MTERKPDHLSWQSWIERQIRDAQRGGAFDDLDGQGRPIEGLDTVHDDLWWVKAKLRDEDINYLPPTIAIRAERANAIDAALRSVTETEARFLIDEVNTRIRYVNSHATSGPPSTVVTIDLNAFIDRWQAERPPEPPTPTDAPLAAMQTEPPGRRRWWHWWRRRPRR